MRLNEIAPPRSRLTDEEFEIAYDKLVQNEMSKDEINEYSHIVVDAGMYPRTKNSLQFLLTRMHIVLHGEAPSGETPERADKMFKDTKPIIDYVLRQGHLDKEDIDYHIDNAKEELASRPTKAEIEAAEAEQRAATEDAYNRMYDYYRANKASMPKKFVKDAARYKEALTNAVAGGLTPEQAFAQYM